MGIIAEADLKVNLHVLSDVLGSGLSNNFSKYLHVLRKLVLTLISYQYKNSNCWSEKHWLILES